MKQIRLTENDLHKIISESVKKVLNELDSKTYMNAANKVKAYGQHKRSKDFSDYANKAFDKETGEQDNNTFKLFRDGFNLEFRDEMGLKMDITYDEGSDKIFDMLNKDKVLKPGSYELRMDDRRLVNKILAYFNKFVPDSQYNNKNLWIK